MLDSTVYLASYGWKGKGTGLRQGSASRPLAIPQKRTLAGLGKDRDEAFPFWDHLFAAAAKSIQIKVSGDETVTEGDSGPQATLLRTATGILSNRRPIAGTPATSGTATPSDPGPQGPSPRLSLLAIAKRHSAHKRLYAAFFRGPTLGPDTEHEDAAPISSGARMVEEIQTIGTRSDMRLDEKEPEGVPREKRKRKRDDDTVTQERKRERKEKKKRRHHDDRMDGELAATSTQGAHKCEEQQDTQAGCEVNGQILLVQHGEIPNERSKRKTAKAERKKLKHERKIRKEERRKRKEERRRTKEVRTASMERRGPGTSESPKN